MEAYLHVNPNRKSVEHGLQRILVRTCFNACLHNLYPRFTGTRTA